jgi:glyoxylase-like metal-dependent hydrolase (beta-lactamase superfamily II)/rhodanese-related sulfurtransferase
MIFRQLFDTGSSTYTYLLGCGLKHEAIVIDPVFEKHDRDVAMARELGLDVRFVLDTHVHADHVTGAWLMKQALDARIAGSAKSGVTCLDLALIHDQVLEFGECAIEVRETPGHTAGCLTFVTIDKSMAFTGDCLLIRGAGRTDFQGGDVHQMWRSIREQIFSLPDECLLYPGHDYAGRTVSTVGEEKRFNPRIGGDAREEDFAGYMNNLGLDHPSKIDIAVPANLQCGRPDDREEVKPASWGPVITTFAGVPEISPEWVAANRDSVHVLDVRARHELAGELGRIDGSQCIPLDDLRESLQEVPSDRPVVTVCQSGKRSAMAVMILRKAGWREVANVYGGMIEWNRQTLPVETNSG